MKQLLKLLFLTVTSLQCIGITFASAYQVFSFSQDTSVNSLDNLAERVILIDKNFSIKANLLATDEDFTNTYFISIPNVVDARTLAVFKRIDILNYQQAIGVIAKIKSEKDLIYISQVTHE